MNTTFFLAWPYGFIIQDKETKKRELFPGYVGGEKIEKMIEDCDYVELMYTTFAREYALYRSSQILKLFHDCGAKLPFTMNDAERLFQLYNALCLNINDWDWLQNPSC